MQQTHTIAWDNDAKTVVLQIFLPGATLKDMHEMAEESAAMLKTVSHTVHIIIWFNGSRPFIVNSREMRHLEQILPPNQGTVVVVTSVYYGEYARVVRGLMATYVPKVVDNLVHLNRVEEARQYLVDHVGVTFP